MGRLIRLQGICMVPAIHARVLKPGMVMVWNYGKKEAVTGITPAKSGKTLKVNIRYENFNGKTVESVRQLGVNRLVAVE